MSPQYFECLAQLADIFKTKIGNEDSEVKQQFSHQVENDLLIYLTKGREALEAEYAELDLDRACTCMPEIEAAPSLAEMRMGNPTYLPPSMEDEVPDKGFPKPKKGHKRNKK